MTLLENRLSSLNLENPVRDIEIEVIPCPEQTRQLDFFEPRTTDQDKVETLFSLLLQSKVQPGFYQIEPCIMPEQGWRLSTTAPVPESARGHENNNYLPQLTPAHSSSSTLTTALSTDTERTADNEQAISEDKLVQPMPWYGKPVARAPRPTRLLRIPRAISFAELERLKILSSSPIERLESSWWEREEESSRPGSNLPLHTSSLPTAVLLPARLLHLSRAQHPHSPRRATTTSPSRPTDNVCGFSATRSPMSTSSTAISTEA
jgi:hypothetical protein